MDGDAPSLRPPEAQAILTEKRQGGVAAGELPGRLLDRQAEHLLHAVAVLVPPQGWGPPPVNLRTVTASHNRLIWGVPFADGGTAGPGRGGVNGHHPSVAVHPARDDSVVSSDVSPRRTIRVNVPFDADQGAGSEKGAA